MVSFHSVIHWVRCLYGLLSVVYTHMFQFIFMFKIHTNLPMSKFQSLSIKSWLGRCPEITSSIISLVFLDASVLLLVKSRTNDTWSDTFNKQRTLCLRLSVDFSEFWKQLFKIEFLQYLRIENCILLMNCFLYLIN